MERLLAAGLVAIAAGLAALAALGPLATGAVDYRVTETLRNQTIGLDLASVAVVAPLALAAAALSLRGRPAGPALALGIGAYTSYMQLQYVLGPDYLGLDGNNERVFPLCLALFALGWLVCVAAWRALGEEPLRLARPRRRLLGGVVLPVLAFAAFVRYLPELGAVTRVPPESDGYLAGPSFFWAIALLDLGVFLPATVLACVGLLRGARWAPRTLYLVVGWFGLVGPAVAAMAVAMVVNDDPVASGGNAAVMIGLGFVFVLLAAAVLAPVARQPASGSSRPSASA